MSDRGLRVMVCYALPEEQEVIGVEVPEGSTLADAIEASGLLTRHPGIDVATARIGVYGKLCPSGTLLRDRDRVEIYRPLIADPKEVRRRRAEEGKAMRKGGGGT